MRSIPWIMEERCFHPASAAFSQLRRSQRRAPPSRSLGVLPRRGTKLGRNAHASSACRPPEQLAVGEGQVGQPRQQAGRPLLLREGAEQAGPCEGDTRQAQAAQAGQRSQGQQRTAAKVVRLVQAQGGEAGEACSWDRKGPEACRPGVCGMLKAG